MDKKQIDSLAKNCKLPGNCENISIKETHISWIILTGEYAFKIKKPVRFSFLDFSTLQNRKYFCYEELALNRRLEPEMYVDVIPVTDEMIEGEQYREGQKIIDYAVMMKRMDDDKQMSAMLEENKVDNHHIDGLAKKIASFHSKANLVKNAFDTLGLQEKFADISKHFEIITEEFGDELKEKIQNCIKISHTWLNQNRSTFNERVISGLRRDVHGDLNAANIFLYEEPVIFDCIEFDKEYRHIDLLNEIAFLTIDLEFYDRKDLSNRFYAKYVESLGLKKNPYDEAVLNYFKSYRANIRAKVSLINASEHENDKKLINDAKKYLDLLLEYSEKL